MFDKEQIGPWSDGQNGACPAEGFARLIPHGRIESRRTHCSMRLEHNLA